jgi:hypothetical protein
MAFPITRLGLLPVARREVDAIANPTRSAPGGEGRLVVNIIVIFIIVVIVVVASNTLLLLRSFNSIIEKSHNQLVGVDACLLAEN